MTTTAQLVATYRDRIARDPEAYDGLIDMVMWLIEDTAPRDWSPSELARALRADTREVHDALPVLVSDGYVVSSNQGARSRYTARRR